MDTQDHSGARAGAAQGRRFSFTLSPGTLISGAILLLLGFVAVFALGILLGRGHSPETRIPEIARIMPTPAPTTAPTVITPGERNATDSAAPAPDPAAEETPAEGGRVMGEQDLAYRDRLKSTAAPGGKAPARAEGRSAPKPEETKKAAPEKKPAEAPPRKTGTESAGPARPKTSDTRVYHYVYQAASYKEQAPSDAFAARLRAAGFRARTEKSDGGGVIWYRTVVDFTGRPDDTDALRDSLQKHGVPKVLLRAKLPAN